MSDAMTNAFEETRVGQRLDGPRFSVTRETIRAVCDASLDYNPLHLDDKYMEGSFGKTEFGGVIMHGMTNFGLITRMLTDWLCLHGGIHRRLETRWRAPVRPGDSIQPAARIAGKKVTHLSRWVILDIEIRNQDQALVATGEAIAEFPHALETSIGA